MEYLIYSIISVVCWGMVSFIAKIISSHLSPETAAFITISSASMILALYVFSTKAWQVNVFTLYAAIIGLLEGIAMIAFYKALATGPVSVVCPVTALYLVIPVILGVLLLSEKLSRTQGLGIFFAILAIFLLLTNEF